MTASLGGRLCFHSLIPPVVLLAVLIGSCEPRPDDYVQFKKLPEEQQRARFKELSVDKQIDYYLYDQNREPADMILADELARQGKTILPQLLHRLSAETEDYRRRDLIWILELMHRKFEPLNENREVIVTVEQVISRMKEPEWQRMSQKSLDLIRAEALPQK